MKVKLGKYTGYLGLALLLPLLSCNSGASESTEVATIATFFSLSDFFSAEIDRLNTAQPECTKTLRVGGKEETQSGATLNYETELAAFLDSDINKPSWSDKYKVDSVFSNAGQLASLHYVAQDSGMYTREIRLGFDSLETVRTCFVRNRLTNFISDFRQNLYYDRQSGFRMTVLQGFGEDAREPVEISVAFSK